MPRALLAAVPVAAAAVLGSLATAPNIPTWYVDLAKPGFTPPNWVFGPVWTVLYIAMAYAAWRILSHSPERPRRTAALRMFFVQLALNAAWSWAFFGARSPVAGLVVIVLLETAVIATAVLVWHLDRVAALLLVPYAAWVAYATALSFAIWRMNA